MRKTTKIIKRRETIEKTPHGTIKTTVTTTKVRPESKRLQRLRKHLEQYDTAKGNQLT